MLALTILRRLGTWRKSRTLRRELEGLTDRQLTDIGLRRDQIDLVAHGGLVRSSALTL
ncbi:MAG: DUF1127 domain-containing protein [Alphaproteobacteria bacterium]